MIAPLTVYIGYDCREHAAYEVCRASLLEHTSRPLHIVRLDESALRQAGLYRREWRLEGKQRIDQGDLKPFSTDFAFTRFLVPALNLYEGWALFCDCDFLFTSDIAELFDLADPAYAVRVVKHNHDPREQSKMNGLAQSKYYRKNWSSLVLWNCAHSMNRAGLTINTVNDFPGAWLHAFQWLDDNQIGSLPARWNWLAGVDDPLGILPSGIHFTLGVPTIHPGAENAPYADVWRAYQAFQEAA